MGATELVAVAAAEAGGAIYVQPALNGWRSIVASGMQQNSPVPDDSGAEGYPGVRLAGDRGRGNRRGGDGGRRP